MRMTGDQGIAFSEENQGVTVMTGIDLKHGLRRQVFKKYSALNF
jgi:hypothetical protein